eukprot:1071774-Prymnesium_polylepis.2
MELPCPDVPAAPFVSGCIDDGAVGDSDDAARDERDTTEGSCSTVDDFGFPGDLEDACDDPQQPPHLAGRYIGYDAAVCHRGNAAFDVECTTPLGG